jgi:hypothetical protein
VAPPWLGSSCMTIVPPVATMWTRGRLVSGTRFWSITFVYSVRCDFAPSRT